MSEYSPFILVHGAYHGGWCWDAVSQLLQPHPVFAPTLAGLSERRGEITRAIDLNHHIQEIVDLIESQDLNHVHLVGWSYGGMVITGVLARIPTRISAITYLDAYLPSSGQSASSFVPLVGRALLSLSTLLGKGIQPPDPQAWGITDGGLPAQYREKLSAQPPATLTQGVQAPSPWPDHLTSTYVWCSGYTGSIFEQFYRKARADQHFNTIEITTSHGAVITAPETITDILLGQV